ncbi:hypothetical protein BKA81DRAFT_345299 [Phyllosticta paracitricarpa]
MDGWMDGWMDEWMDRGWVSVLFSSLVCFSGAGFLMGRVMKVSTATASQLLP